MVFHTRRTVPSVPIKLYRYRRKGEGGKRRIRYWLQNVQSRGRTVNLSESFELKAYRFRTAVRELQRQHRPADHSNAPICASLLDRVRAPARASLSRGTALKPLVIARAIACGTRWLMSEPRDDKSQLRIPTWEMRNYMLIDDTASSGIVSRRSLQCRSSGGSLRGISQCLDFRSLELCIVDIVLSWCHSPDQCNVPWESALLMQLLASYNEKFPGTVKPSLPYTTVPDC